MVGPDPAVRRRDARAGAARAAARVQAAARVVHRAPARPDRQRRLHARRRASERRLLAIVDPRSAAPRAGVMLDEREFLSPYGIRALSRAHRDAPYVLPSTARATAWTTSRPSRRPASSAATRTGAGPIWFPVNFLLIEALQKFHHYSATTSRWSARPGSGRMMTLAEVAAELSRRLSRIFLRDADGRRPVFGAVERSSAIPHWRDLILFHEYFHGDTAPASAPATRPAGRRSSPSCCSRQSGERR